ncbi:sulfotransferase [Streptomyces sp. B6B3]|uniref:sulfotransferase family protein n=1 Tax=Streptomyces sp. B6B3 TaxID=3153570 RepID=UPI00325D9AB9
MAPLTFVVGTGRSGSTTLSRIVNLHPDVLSLNELCASLVDPDRALPAEPMTGGDFWRLLAEPNPFFDAMIRGGAPLPEFLDPRPGLAAVRLMVLPHLTDDPARLQEELARVVPKWPSRPAAEHFLALFDTLRLRFDRRVVVERSGYSLHWVPRLRACFPEARFVHLHRDGPDCALSMSRHVGYRTIALVHEVMAVAGVGRLADITPEHVAALPLDLAAIFSSSFDPVLIRDAALPVHRYAELWSKLVVEGVDHLAAVPAAARTSLSYEALLAEPDRELTRLAEFVGVTADPGWLAAARGLLDPARAHPAARALTPTDYAAVEAACAPGTQALTTAG